MAALLRALSWTSTSLHFDNGTWCDQAGLGKRGQRSDTLSSMRQLRQTVGRTTAAMLGGRTTREPGQSRTPFVNEWEQHC